MQHRRQAAHGRPTGAARRAQRGVHFFRPVPKEYLHSAELRDIMQFGSSSQAVFFKMRVAGVLHIFQFDTRQARSTTACGVVGRSCCSARPASLMCLAAASIRPGAGLTSHAPGRSTQRWFASNSSGIANMHAASVFARRVCTLAAPAPGSAADRARLVSSFWRGAAHRARTSAWHCRPTSTTS